jgi:hypothetical protein
MVGIIVNCPNCKKSAKSVYKNKAMPYGISLKDIKIDIEIEYCVNCGFTFQSSSYNEEYDFNISKLYESYTISNMYNFPNRSITNIKALDFISEDVDNEINFNVLEIGSNRGDFLYLLKEKFPNINILGCEPTNFKELSIPTINAFFDKNLFNTKFDLIILRHTLEHIKNPKLFIEELEYLQKNSSKLFIEVPNIVYSLENFIEDFTPDHVNFFDSSFLINLVNKKVLKLDDREYLYVLFENSKADEKSEKSSFNLIELFKTYEERVEQLLDKVSRYDRIIFYGISNFYLWTFSKLKDKIKDKEVYFMDDFLKEDKINNLPKLDKLNKNDLVILCSSNKNIQRQMSEKLPKNISILYPWEKIINV